MIEGPPLLTVQRDLPRPDPALLAPLQGVPTGYVIDAMDGAGALVAAIKPIDPARAAFVGVALPCQTGPGDNLAVMAAPAPSYPIPAPAADPAGSACRRCAAVSRLPPATCWSVTPTAWW